MAKQKKNTSGLIPIKKGHSGNPNGRPKKVLSKMPDGYTLIDLQNTIKNIYALRTEELKLVVLNADSTVLELLVAKGLAADLQKGVAVNSSLFFNRAFGMPKQEQTIDARVSQTIQTSSLTLDELDLLAKALPLPKDDDDDRAE